MINPANAMTKAPTSTPFQNLFFSSRLSMLLSSQRLYRPPKPEVIHPLEGHGQITLMFPMLAVLYVFPAAAAAFLSHGSVLCMPVKTFQLNRLSWKMPPYHAVQTNSGSQALTASQNERNFYTFKCLRMVKKLAKNPIPSPRSIAAPAIYGKIWCSGRNWKIPDRI